MTPCHWATFPAPRSSDGDTRVRSLAAWGWADSAGRAALLTVPSSVSGWLGTELYPSPCWSFILKQGAKMPRLDLNLWTSWVCGTWCCILWWLNQVCLHGRAVGREGPRRQNQGLSRSRLRVHPFSSSHCHGHRDKARLDAKVKRQLHNNTAKARKAALQPAI